MILKKFPEDFIVDEVFKRELSEGRYTIFKLKKTDYTTPGAISEVAKQLKVQIKNISYAGLKDRRAITTQYISVLNAPQNFKFEHPNIELERIGTSKGPVSLGDLEGNNFKITMREAENLKVKEKPAPNLFDEQRFSTQNHIIGRHLVKKEFKLAVDKILQFDESKARHLIKVLDKNPNDYVNSLRQIQPKMLLLYVHAYQSYLWNKTVELYLKQNPNSKQRQIPIIGFGVEIPGDLEPIISQVLEEEQLDFRSFIIRQIPDLSAEGTNRELYIDYQNLKCEYLDKDVIYLEFFLPKGCYATMLVKQLVENGSSGI